MLPAFKKRPEELIQRPSKENEKSFRKKYIDERLPRVQGDALFTEYTNPVGQRDPAQYFATMK